jgi:superfamily II DNA or RNA helicase
VTQKPWTVAAYELLRHGDLHRQDRGGFDLRMALISYDNAIELSVTTYLSLHPEQRSGRTFSRTDVDQWRVSYVSKVQFFEHYVTRILKQEMIFTAGELIFYHRIRNQLYHEDVTLIPRIEHVDAIREAAVWVFSSLFDVEASALLAQEAAGAPLEINDTRTLSPEDRLFALVLELRKDFELLRQSIGHTLRTPATEEQLLKAALGESDPAMNRRMTDALKAAEQIATSLADERTVAANSDEIDELTALLSQLKERLARPLRAYQENLATQAVKATLTAIEAGQRSIGIIYQPVGSGLSATAAAYVALVSKHSTLENLPIVVVSDRSVVVDQLFECIRDVCADGKRSVLRLSTQTLAIALSGQVPCIGATTIQSLRVAFEKNPYAGAVLLVAVGFDIDAYAATLPLNDAYIISFLNMLRGIGSSQASLIGKYSFDQALREGYLTPAEIYRHSVSGLDVIPDEIEESDSSTREVLASYERRETGGWTRLQVEKLATEIFAHFEVRQKEGARALVIVSSIDAAMRFCEALRRVAFEKGVADGSFVDVLSSDLPGHFAAYMTDCFQSEKASLSVLIVAKMWSGIDLSLVDLVYVTCRMNPSSLWRLAEGLSAPRGEKRRAALIDYARNDFSRPALD